MREVKERKNVILRREERGRGGRGGGGRGGGGRGGGREEKLKSRNHQEKREER